MKTIYLAGGCFWGIQKYMDQFDGIIETVVGYANGYLDDPTYEDVKAQKSGHAETVKIVCLDQNGEGANKTLLDAVYNYIMAPDNPADRLAPPNTILTVAAPDLVNISYSFTVTVADGFELSTVVSGFKKQLESYYKTVANDGAVKYIKVHALLTETPGVEDFTDLLINGSTDNIHIENDEYPYTENVEAKEAE